MSQELSYAELLRRFENLLRYGEIVEIDFTQHLCKVALGDITTNWLSTNMLIGHNVRVHTPLRIGTLVLVACPSGHLPLARIVAILPSEKINPPSNQSNLDLIEFNDGTQLSYDSEVSKLKISGTHKINIICDNATVKASGDVKVDASNIKLNGGKGVVTGGHICALTGLPHSDCSPTVTAEV